MNPVRHPPLLTFGTALVVSVLALVLALTTPLRMGVLYLLLMVAIVISARYGGLGPGLFAILVTTAATIIFFLPPIDLLTVAGLDEALRLATFVLIALFAVALVSRETTQQRTAEEKVSWLATIVNASEDAIINKTLDGTILTWNPSAERLFGYPANEVVGKSIRIIYPPDRLNEFVKTLERLKRRELIDHFDTVRVAKDGRRIDVSIIETLIRDARGSVIGVSKVVRDITQRKYAEETARFLTEVSDVLASSLDYKTTLVSIARLAVPQIADWCAVHVKTEDGTIQQLALTHVDPAKVQIAQDLQRRYLDDSNAPYSAPNVIQTGKAELLARITAEQFAAATSDLEALKILPDLGLKSLMVVPLTAPGETFGAITFVSAESGRHYGQADLALAQDLARLAALAVENARLYHKAQSMNEELDQRVAQRTSEIQTANEKLETEIAEHKRSTEQLRLLAVHLQSVLEEERVRIAREIHDQIGQMMTAVKMDLALLERNLTRNGSKESPEMLREEIGSTTKLVDDAIATMHEIVRELRPAVLDHLGLRAAIEWQLQDFQDRTKIECQFKSDLDELDQDPARSTAVFRILQETLTNVARHAHATHVQASLRKEDNHLILQVRDNGKGISEKQISNVNTFGLLGMRERAHVFGGEVVVRGSPGQGTVVTVRIPAKPLSGERQ